MFGPLVVAAVLARHGSYHLAFAVLLVPALINLAFVCRALALSPPTRISKRRLRTCGRELPRICGSTWGAALVAAGFADYPIIAYHFGRTSAVPGEWIAIFYAVAMAVSGSGSLLFGRLLDRFGFSVLIGLTLLSASFAPLVFLGGFWTALIGAAIWGLGIGVHESISFPPR
jgi:MFS family permease